jgi:hypothetical protein
MNKLIYLAVFTVFGLLAFKVPINQLAGANVNFTLFDLLAPISGAFIGSGFGVLAVLLMGVFNLLINGFSAIDRGSVIRLFPILFAVWAFSRRDKLSLFVSVAAIISFNLNPVGRSVWFYSMFWTIPIFLWPLRNRSLMARSLAATFTAHAAGGAVWIWAFSLPASVWAGLIPVVIVERALFALGISASYILTNNAIAFLSAKKLVPAGITFSKKYLFLKRS